MRSEGVRPWLVRLGVLVWIGLAAAILFVSQRDEAPTPASAERRFGSSRSSLSSAPSGLLAFARTLERLGLETDTTRSGGPPDADILVLLAPEAQLAPVELESLMQWVSNGGRLIYAASEETDTGEGDGAAQSSEAGDRVLAEVAATGRQLEARGGSAVLWRVGAGFVAVLPSAGEALSNARMKEVGLAPELPWLRVLIAGKRRIAFDEARLGWVEQAGPVELLLGSRLGTGLRLLAVAFLVWLTACGVRRTPAVIAPGPARSVAEHLDAVARALRNASRWELAMRLLVAGTRARLGRAAAGPKAAPLLDALTLPPQQREELVTAGATLQRLESSWEIARHERRS